MGADGDGGRLLARPAVRRALCGQLGRLWPGGWVGLAVREPRSRAAPTNGRLN
jgi:hypothetical protein